MLNLRKIPSYHGLVDYLEHHQEIIKYPNRKASIIIDNGLGDIFETYEQKKDGTDDNNWHTERKPINSDRL